MAFVSQKYALNIMEKNKAKYWKLYDSDGSMIGEQQDGDLDIDSSISALEEALEEVESGWVTISANTKKGKELAQGGDIKSGSFKFKVRIGDTGTGGRKSESSGTMEKFYELKFEFEKFKLEKEYEKKSGDNNKDPYEKFLEKIGNIVEIEYLEERKLQRGEKTISGTGTEKKESTPASEHTKEVIHNGSNKDKVVSALTDLASVDKNAADNLLKLAAWAKANPELYKAYVQNL